MALLKVTTNITFMLLIFGGLFGSKSYDRRISSVSLYVRVSTHVSVCAHGCGSVPFERRGQNKEAGVEMALEEEGRAFSDPERQYM